MMPSARCCCSPLPLGEGRVRAAVICMVFIALAAVSREEDFNEVAIKINTQDVSVREVERLFADSYVLIQDKLKRGELRDRDLEAALRAGWTDAIETATQDKITDQRADKYRREIAES